jgi:hypothetical protein
MAQCMVYESIPSRGIKVVNVTDRLKKKTDRWRLKIQIT